MRIISGALRGREIRAPKGEVTRPAMARTREAVFSMLESRGINWPDTRALDLFAGTGSLAFEALSRGAPSALLVDNSPELAVTLAGSIADLGLEARARIARLDVLRFLRRPVGLKFGLIFVDPPYRRDFTSPVLAQLMAGGWLSPGAFIVAEIESCASVKIPAGLIPETDRLFGQTKVHIWRKD